MFSVWSDGDDDNAVLNGLFTCGDMIYDFDTIDNRVIVMTNKLFMFLVIFLSMQCVLVSVSVSSLMKKVSEKKAIKSFVT